MGQRKVMYGSEGPFDVVEDLGLLLLLRRRQRRRYFRRRRCVLADRDETSLVDEEPVTMTVKGSSVKTLLPLEVVRSEIFGFVGCARCVARCVVTCRAWRRALPMSVVEFALATTTEVSCHDAGALRAKAILVATARDPKVSRAVASKRILTAVHDADPRVRACAFRGAKERRIFVPLDRLREALFDDWKARRNAQRYKRWHDALKPAIEKEDWPSYEHMVHCYAAVHEAGQRAALDVCGAAFLLTEEEEEGRRSEMVEFLASLMATYSQRRVAKDAVAKWDAATSEAFVAAVVEHLFSSQRYRRRTNAQHQAIVDVATPARGCGPALALAILQHLDGADLQRRLAARHALQIIVDCHAHRVSFITHHLVPACVNVADRTDWAQILHHVYHFCVPSWTAVIASLKHAVFCASVAIAVGAALAAAVALGNLLVCSCKASSSSAFLSSSVGDPLPASSQTTTTTTTTWLEKKTFTATPAVVEAASSYVVTNGLSLATPCLAFLDLNWLNSCLGSDVSDASTDDDRGDPLPSFTPPPPTPTGPPKKDRLGGTQDDGFTWTEVALMVMYSLFLPFLLVLHLVWLVDDFLCELQFLTCSRPFRDACVTGLLASIGA